LSKREEKHLLRPFEKLLEQPNILEK